MYWQRRTRQCLALLATAGLGLAVAPAGAAGAGRGCEPTRATPVPQPTAQQMAAAGLGRLPAAPERQRVDLIAPPFSNPTGVTNPLFPISNLSSVVLNGRVDGRPFRTETTLLPDTRVIEWSPGQCVRTLVSQYVAYLGGRIQEVALDFYAQGDDGSVWYFGEDVYNYRGGAVEDTSGTWLAGKEGPAAMIMPAHPKAGDVNRPENIPGLVWEEVAIRSVGRTVKGPLGPVAGAIVGRELHDDGAVSDKVFAPGYGEFYTADRGEVEALALAVPTDALPGPPPGELRRLLRDATAAYRGAGAGRWRAASAAVARMGAAWRAHRARGVPRRLVSPTSRALAALGRAVQARDRRRARHAALDSTLAILDLQLRFRPPAEIDRARADLWARRISVDATDRNRAAVRGDVATLEWIRDRIAGALDKLTLTRVDARLEELRANVTDGELAQASKTATALRRAL
jgi:hypothetical protein